MKSSHQLKSIRRKIIRSARRETLESAPPPNLSLSSPAQAVLVEESTTVDKKRSTPRMMKTQSYH